MHAIRLTSRFIRPDDLKIIDDVQQKLQSAGLTPVTDVELIERIQQVRMSVESIRLADEAMQQRLDKEVP